MQNPHVNSTVQLVAMVVVSACTLVGVALVTQTLIMLVRTIKLGAPDSTRHERNGERARSLVAETLGHSRLGRNRWVGFLHWWVFLGFGALFLTLVTAYGQLADPTFALPIIGHTLPFEWLTEIFAWMTLLGILTLTAIRLRNRPQRNVLPAVDAAQTASGDTDRRSRFFGSNLGQAYYVEATIATVALCIITLRALEYALARTSDPGPGDIRQHYPTTAWIGEGFHGLSVSTLATGIVMVATIKIVVSMAWFIVIARHPTMGVAWHRLLAFVNIWFKRHPGTKKDGGRSALGELQPIRVRDQALDFTDPDELPDDASLGVTSITDFNWKDLLDVSTCTECGRCQSVCPAWNTGKPLSPKLFTMSLRDELHAQAPDLLTMVASTTPTTPAPDTPPLVGTTITPEVLWSCTTCGACVHECPVDIEHVDHIVDLRRGQVLMESIYPSALEGTFKNLERHGNPWGVPAKQRLDWTKGLDFTVPVFGADVESLSEVEYLFWVGCAGAFESRQQQTTRAVAELLHRAEVSYAVLGEGESCNGDPARRAGNEFLFAMLASAAIETLREAEATRVVVTCAHCFNTMTREFPQLDGVFEVVHHTQLLNRLVRSGALVPVAPPSGGTTNDGRDVITYHDPCYLGRHNGVYAPPRELVRAVGVEVREMPRNHDQSFCCGAGGARMWQEETIGTRINTARAQEAIDTGASTVAVACPFCRVMLGDGVDGLAGEAAESELPASAVTVTDVATLLLDAVRRGD